MGLFDDARTLESVVFQAIGAGSVCWEKPEGAGVFDMDKAVEVGNDAMARISEFQENALLLYSEWLDTEGLMKKPKKKDHRTHEDLVREFIGE